MTAINRRWISVTECAQRLGMHPQSIYTLISRGAIPAGRLGRKVLVDWRALEDHLDERICGGVKGAQR